MLILQQPTGGVVVVLDKTPEEPREKIEMKASKEVKQVAAAETLQDRLQAAMGAAGFQTPQRGGGRGLGAESGSNAGALAAAGVLTAVDEDEEDGEEAPVPDEFEYESDGVEE